ncbi:4'-phosphopantetheinyl transferase [Kitasatospora sp. MAA4]|uniref:4'-phosphopantetheinyl transferase family protein n=1 Tax=Kitasatospora sp. MAA4 TaxID=3035093 RepID=UPI002474877B|nr:4'-phosphopantetheinyl transferase superfamily protein [Kitasatospora sp. MAA4]MDH6131427.1 4'-phosphopantetheinyl transferase [Kitasatospora sp. MAA4]
MTPVRRPLVEVVVGRVAGGEREAARRLVLGLAARVAGVPVAGLRLERAASGQPYLVGGELRVSVSHARGVVAVAASRELAVGVDVETVRPLPVEALARRWFPPNEAAWTRRWGPDRQAQAFLWLWTQKEALAKALGQGLGGGVGLLRPVELPDGWPRRFPPLTATPGVDELAVTAGAFNDLMVAVAAAGRGAAGADVRVRHARAG